MLTDDEIDALLDDLMVREGGYGDDPDDPGGPTKYGVTAEVLGQWRKLGRPATAEEVAALSSEDVRQIAIAEYIRKPRFARLPLPIAEAVIDYGYHHGTRTATMALQRALGVRADGVLGPRTHAAAWAADPITLRAALVRRRLEFMATWLAAKPRRHKYVKGFIRRAASFLPERA